MKTQDAVSEKERARLGLIRSAEAAAALELIRHWAPVERPRILEIGCGDGLQSRELRAIGPVVATDLDVSSAVNAAGLAVAACDCCALPFVEDAFDVVFSSNVLEHVADKSEAFQELSRVVAPGGVQIHIVPTHWWKALDFVGYYYVHVVGAFRRLATIGRASGGAADMSRRQRRRLWYQRWLPPVHGVAAGHMQEWREFEPRWWRGEFAANGYRVVAERPLFLYSPTGFPLVRCSPPRLGVFSTVAFVIVEGSDRGARTSASPTRHALPRRHDR